MQVSKVKFIKNFFQSKNIRYKENIKILSFAKIYIQNINSVKIKQKSVNEKDENLKFQNNLNKQSFLKS